MTNTTCTTSHVTLLVHTMDVVLYIRAASHACLLLMVGSSSFPAWSWVGNQGCPSKTVNLLLNHGPSGNLEMISEVTIEQYPRCCCCCCRYPSELLASSCIDRSGTYQIRADSGSRTCALIRSRMAALCLVWSLIFRRRGNSQANRLQYRITVDLFETMLACLDGGRGHWFSIDNGYHYRLPHGRR